MPYIIMHYAKNQALTHLTQQKIGKIIFDALKKSSIIQIAPIIFGAKIQTIRFKSQLAQIKDLLSLLEKKLFICLEIHISFKESSGLYVYLNFRAKTIQFIIAVLSCTFLL